MRQLSALQKTDINHFRTRWVIPVFLPLAFAEKAVYFSGHHEVIDVGTSLLAPNMVSELSAGLFSVSRKRLELALPIMTPSEAIYASFIMFFVENKCKRSSVWHLFRRHLQLGKLYTQAPKSSASILFR